MMVSTGTFIEGHVKLDVLFTLLEKNLNPGGFILLTARTTMWEQAVEEQLKAHS